ncbi:MAG TPA: zf-HC2 domain-containing protein [Gemmatimonadaceae bacterium]|nr:zf-HC2 domain-containing protein [Gemmatimonadaceae bacterium]
MTSIADDLACQDFVELVTAYLEGTLPSALAARLRAHLDLCSDCERYLDQMQLTVRTLRRTASESLPPRMRDVLVALYRRSREHEGG